MFITGFAIIILLFIVVGILKKIPNLSGLILAFIVVLFSSVVIMKITIISVDVLGKIDLSWLPNITMIGIIQYGLIAMTLASAILAGRFIYYVSNTNKKDEV